MKTGARHFLLLGAIFAAIAVAAGAFGAHFLKGVLDASMLVVFETAARYQMYHALGLCIVSWAIDRYPEARLTAVGWLFTIGFAKLIWWKALLGVMAAGGATDVIT